MDKALEDKLSKKNAFKRSKRRDLPQDWDIDPDDCEFFDVGQFDDIDQEFDEIFTVVHPRNLCARRAIEARMDELALRLSLEDFPE